MVEPIEPAAVDHAVLSTVDQFWRFAIVGTIGFVVDSTVLMIERNLLHLDPYSGRLVSFLVAATCTWALNRRFTFRTANDDAAIVQWAKFLGANALGFAANYATYVAVLNFVPLVDSGYLAPLPGVSIANVQLILSVAVGAIVGLFFNFTVNKFWVFRRPL